MTTILAHIRIKPGKEAKFEAIMEDMVNHTMTEPGVLRYEYFKAQKPNAYYCLLAFKDKWAFYDHQNSDYHEGHDFGDVLEAIELEYLDPVTGANELPGTEDPPLTEDMPEGLQRAAQMYPIAVASWWADRK